MKNIKIGRKLTLIFSVILILFSVVVVIALLGLHTANRILTDFQETAGAGAAYQSACATILQIRVFLFIIAALVYIVSILLALTLHKGLLLPIRELEDASRKLEKGDLDITVEYRSKDELGSLAEAFRNMSATLRVIIEDSTRLLQEMTEGNYDIRTAHEASYVGAFRNQLLSMRRLNYSMSDLLGQINESAGEVASGSDQVAFGAQTLSQGAAQQASAVEELAATLEDISGHVETNAQNARQASTQAVETAAEMEKGREQMKRMMEAMEQINDTSGEIRTIIKAIDGIAFQTNLLALNAAVEAAHAGTSGKGFAVVANEVRNLAEKSSEASKNTQLLIENSLKSVREGRQIAVDTAASLERIASSSQKTASLIHQISEASAQQSDSIAQIAVGIGQISDVVQSNSATAEESAAASEELSGQSLILKDLVSRFRLRGPSDHR